MSRISATGRHRLVTLHYEQSAYGVGFDQHYAHARGRPIAWVVVSVIIAGTCVGGISLILATPWLFWAGVGVVVVGIAVGRATHAMRDEMVQLPGASPRQPRRQTRATREFALMSVDKTCALCASRMGRCAAELAIAGALFRGPSEPLTHRPDRGACARRSPPRSGWRRAHIALAHHQRRRWRSRFPSFAV